MPLQRKVPHHESISFATDPRSKGLGEPHDPLGNRLGISPAGTVHLHVIDAEGYELHISHTGCSCRHEYQQLQVVAEHRIDMVVVDQITGIVQDQLVSSVQLDSLKDVRAVSVKNVGACVHHGVSEADERWRGFRAHVGPPVSRDNDEIRTTNTGCSNAVRQSSELWCVDINRQDVRSWRIRRRGILIGVISEREDGDA